ncbi:transglycosylase family protein [Streptomyces nitrosporeus]|uniref:transglycosylase family protein n=1 Tax=Streptomyces nitrosporeus TaxID=28894 RepID=UPI00331E512E
MGSANGRHRRPRQAPAIVVTAGVTGSAIAIPLLGATGANAAEASTWDRVAECESGGMWSADLGNGRYGGLQLSQDTWKSYGGTVYAPRADLASRSQQIAVAEKVLDDQGPQAWASCAVVSGLVLDGGLPGVDPGGDPADTSLPGSTGSTGETTRETDEDTADEASGAAEDDAEGGAGDGAKDPAADAGAADDGGRKGKAGTPGGKETPGDSGGSAPSASPSTAPEPEASQSPGRTGGGKHRGAPAPEAGTGADAGRDTGRHASRGDSGAREDSGADGTYTVREGDNLWSIAGAQDVPGGWTALYEANRGEVGSDPDLILPGQDLDLAAAGTGAAGGTAAGDDTAAGDATAGAAGGKTASGH